MILLLLWIQPLLLLICLLLLRLLMLLHLRIILRLLNQLLNLRLWNPLLLLPLLHRRLRRSPWVCATASRADRMSVAMVHLVQVVLQDQSTAVVVVIRITHHQTGEGDRRLRL